MATIISAIALNHAIGKDNKLLLNDPVDMHMFNLTTVNNTVIMGKNTFNSLPVKPLPNRNNVVISSTMAKQESNFATLPYKVYSSLKSALQHYPDSFIIGGEKIYKEALTLPEVSRMILTVHHYHPQDADTFFPEFNNAQWKPIKKIPYMFMVGKNDFIYSEITHFQKTNN